MPAKKTLAISITIRPGNGVSNDEVGLFCKWVGGLGKELAKSAAVLERPDTLEQHIHAGLLFKEETDQDSVRRRLKKLFATQILEDDRWRNFGVAVCVRAHDNFRGLVGGYFTKEDDCKKLFMEGITQDELEEGKKDRDRGLLAKAKRLCSKSTLIPSLLDVYDELQVAQHRACRNPQEYTEWTARYPDGVKPQDCLDILIQRGYVNYLIHWPCIKKTVHENWTQLISAQRV